MTQAEGDLVQEPDPFIFNKSNRQCAFSPRSHIIKNQNNKKSKASRPLVRLLDCLMYSNGSSVVSH